MNIPLPLDRGLTEVWEESNMIQISDEAILEIIPFSSADGGGSNSLHIATHPIPLPSQENSEPSYKSSIMQRGAHKHPLPLLCSF